MNIRLLLAFLALCLHGAAFSSGKDVALVTSLQGQVIRSGDTDNPDGASQPTQRQLLQSYVKLKQGDQLTLETGSRLQLLYFDNGRMETWRGSGRLKVSNIESQSFGLADPQLSMLSAAMAKQLSRMPTQDSQASAGVARFRSIATPDAIANIENTYRRLRNETPDRSDMNPELYLLSGMFEMRELKRVEQVLNDLQRERGSDQQVKILVSLYQRAIKNSREARGD